MAISTEERLQAFFEAITPHMVAHEVDAMMISITGSGADCPGGFVAATRVGSVGPLSAAMMKEHLVKMHDDMHEVLDEVAQHLAGKTKQRTPIEVN